jgi:hypothetical protein
MVRLRLRIIVLLWRIYNNGVQAIDARDAFTVAPPGKLMIVPAMNNPIDQSGA